MSMPASDERRFDLLLSFAGPERCYAKAIHDILTANGLRVFLDEEYQHEVFGKNLVEYLFSTYEEGGTYALILISRAYAKGDWTTIERRAALDRMRNESEYILPVLVEDAWIQGLSKSTAYLDLRTHGVLGVCEVILRKLKGARTSLQIPEAVDVPRIPNGSLPAEMVAKYLVELCNRPHVSVFGMLVYDKTSVFLRKLLRDPDYWDALDRASGPNFEVFAIRDRLYYEPKAELVTASFLSPARSRDVYYSALLREYFGELQTGMVYPSFLLFLARGGKVSECRLIPLARGDRGLEQVFERLQRLLAVIAEGIDEIGVPAPSLPQLWQHLKGKLLQLDYRLYIQKVSGGDLRKAMHTLASFVDSEVREDGRPPA